MKCESCEWAIPQGSIYCNKCGHKQTSVVVAKYQQAYGAWEVTTEGDCEGRSTSKLGTHIGFIDDIAKSLSPSATYALQFKSVTMPSVSGLRKQVSISFDHEAGFTSMSDEDRANALSKILRGRPVRVERGSYYGSVKLIFLD